MKIFLLLFGVSVITGGNAYVLLQVRKGDNQSNVDALIHKVVPTGNIERIAETGRKHFDNYRYKDKTRDNQGKGLESIVLAINSGATPKDGNTGKSDVFDRLIQRISNFVQDGAINAIPKYRSELEKLHIKPEIVEFRSGKPSVMFEINTKDVLKSIQKFLSSKEIKTYTDKVANKAAMFYRSIRDELIQAD